MSSVANILDGLEATDCTGVLKGNADIPVPSYEPTAKYDKAPLPGHEHLMNHEAHMGVSK